MSRPRKKVDVPFATEKLDMLLDAAYSRGLPGGRLESRERTAFYRLMRKQANEHSKENWAVSTVEEAVRDCAMTMAMQTALLGIFGLTPEAPGWRLDERGAPIDDGRTTFENEVSKRFGKPVAGDEPFAFTLEPASAEAFIDPAYAIAELGYQQDGMANASASFGTIEEDDFEFSIRRCFLCVRFPAAVSVRPRSWFAAEERAAVGRFVVEARSVAGNLNWEVTPGASSPEGVLNGYLEIDNLFAFETGEDGAVVELLVRATPKAASKPLDANYTAQDKQELVRDRLVKRIEQLERFGDSETFILSRHARTLTSTKQVSEGDDGD